MDSAHTNLRNDIASLQTDNSTNLGNIVTNTGDISTNTSTISTVTTAISDLETSGQVNTNKNDIAMLAARMNAQDTEFSAVSLLLNQKKGGVVADYFYVNDHDISLISTRYYCFNTWTVEVGEILDFKANLDAYY